MHVHDFPGEYGFGQSGMTKLELKDLSSFNPQAGNWMIVGDVTMDRNISIDHQEIVGEEERKGKAKKPTEQVPGAVSYEEGSRYFPFEVIHLIRKISS